MNNHRCCITSFPQLCDAKDDQIELPRSEYGIYEMSREDNQIIHQTFFCFRHSLYNVGYVNLIMNKNSLGVKQTLEWVWYRP
mgnify:CR=1 FL=1